MLAGNRRSQQEVSRSSVGLVVLVARSGHLFCCRCSHTLVSVPQSKVSTVTTRARDTAKVEAYRTPPLHVIRESARRAVEARSLRSVAREVGLSHAGLKHFIDGAEPYSPTRRRLLHWYVMHAAETSVASNDTASAALAVLLDAVPLEERGTATAELVAALADLHQKLGVSPPQWLASFLDQTR